MKKLRFKESKSRTSAQDREASKSPQDAKSRLIAVLRNITMAVQVFPFIYTALFVFLFAAYSFSSGVVLDIIDYAAFVSPIVIVAHLVYSRMLKLCKWHRIACALPLIPQAVDQFDVYVYHFDHYEWIVVSATILLTLILFLIAIYKVFYTNDGRIC